MLQNLTKNQKLGLAAVGGGVILYLLWPKQAKAAPKKTTTKPTTTNVPSVKKPVTPEAKKDTSVVGLKSDSFYKDVNGVEWKITHNNKYADGTELPKGSAFVRAVVFNDQSLDGKYAHIWNSRYAEGYGSGIVQSGPVNQYDSLKNYALSKIVQIANQAKEEVNYYKEAEFKGSSSDGSDGYGPGKAYDASGGSGDVDTQTERVSGMNWWKSYTNPITGAALHPYYYGSHGTGAVKNPYYYGTHGYYPSMSYAPLTEQRPGGFQKPHGAVGATNVGPIDIDPFYVEKITLKKRR